MTRRVRLLAILFAVAGITAFNAPIAQALPPPGSWHIRLWMLPPADALGNAACLTNSWHDPTFDAYRALDWKATCYANGTEIVRFRAVAASIDESNNGTYWAALHGVTSQLPNNSCPGGGSVRLAKVKVYGLDGHLNGYMIYAHSYIFNGTSTQFNVQAQAGATLSSAYLTSVGIADTVSDANQGHFTNCWGGWHVHEVNSSDAVMLWNSWNHIYDGVAPPDYCCFVNDTHANWTRRMTAVVNIGE
jgi:hypothetical protein